MRHYLPINVWLEGADCLVVGGGRVALRKARSLVDCGAQVRVVSPEVCSELAELEHVTVEKRGFEERDVEGARIVFAATSDPDVNRAVYDAAHGLGVWVNVVDTPPLCDFIVPASVSRGPLVISISTGGAAPAVAKGLRKKLEHDVSEKFGEYVALLGELRGEVMSRIAEPKRRHGIYTRLAQSDMWELFDQQGPDALREAAGKLLEEG
jgi:precorrin-2 dehydrogenase/sirohydrochlorin ferrochelatase